MRSGRDCTQSVTTADKPISSLPPIQTPRLYLRPCLTGDAEPFRALTNDPAITSAVDFLSFPFERENAERLIAGDGDGRDCFWGVWLNGGGAMIGTVGTHLREPDAIEIGYWFATEMRGRGIAAEAVTAVLAALRTAYPSRAIFASASPKIRHPGAYWKNSAFAPTATKASAQGENDWC